MHENYFVKVVKEACGGQKKISKLVGELARVNKI